MCTERSGRLGRDELIQRIPCYALHEMAVLGNLTDKSAWIQSASSLPRDEQEQREPATAAESAFTYQCRHCISSRYCPCSQL